MRKIRTTYASRIQFHNQSAIDVFPQINKLILRAMASSEKYKSPRVNCDWKKTRKVNAPISIKDLMVNELPQSINDRNMRKLSLHTDPSNEDSTRVKQKIPILGQFKKPY